MYCAPSMHLISTDLAGYLLYGIDPLWHGTCQVAV